MCDVYVMCVQSSVYIHINCIYSQADDSSLSSVHDQPSRTCNIVKMPAAREASKHSVSDA